MADMMVEPTDPIDRLILLIETWTDRAFALPRGGQAEALNADWRALARVLSGSQAQHVTDAPVFAFHDELRRNAREGHTGAVPRQALEQRLRELVAGGMSDLFLAVALRQALDTLIATHYPATLPLWQELADSYLPVHWQWSTWETPKSSAVVEDPSHAILRGQKPTSEMESE
jgi:hypothetical protein